MCSWDWLVRIVRHWRFLLFQAPIGPYYEDITTVNYLSKGAHYFQLSLYLRLQWRRNKPQQYLGFLFCSIEVTFKVRIASFQLIFFHFTEKKLQVDFSGIRTWSLVLKACTMTTGQPPPQKKFRSFRTFKAFKVCLLLRLLSGLVQVKVTKVLRVIEWLGAEKEKDRERKEEL